MRQTEQIAQLQADVLKTVGNPPLTAPTRQALDAALAALASDPDLTAAMRRYRDALAAAVAEAGGTLEDALTAATGAPVAFLRPILDAARSPIAAARLAQVDLDGGFTLGPAGVSLTAPIATVRPDPAAAADAARAALAHLPISGFGTSLDLGPVQVSGAGYLDPSRRAAGALLSAELGFARADLALLLDAADDVAVLGLLRAAFRPTGIQLGLGFSLDAVGGLVGVNRTVDGDAMRRRIADGSALDALFGGGGSSADQIRRTLNALGDLFPPRPGTHVVGPTLRLGWMTIQDGSLARLEIGVILVLPAGRVLLPGRVIIEVPGPAVPLVHLRLDVLGEVDVPGQRLALDAALVDSQVMGTLTVSGTAAVRLAWGDQPVLLATIGGFYPGFRPDPVAIPPQRRIGIALANPIPVGLRITLEGYVATAAGTLQAGARASVAFEVLGTGISGSAGFDAIVQLSPLWFEARVFGSVALRALGRRLLAVELSGTLTGPGPMVLHARATGEILGFDVGGSKSFTLSGAPGADRAPFDGLRSVVGRVLRDGAHVTSEDGGDPDVVLAPRPPADGVPLLSPSATLVWSQETFPLDGPFTKADGRTLRLPSAVRVDGPGMTHTVTRRLTAAAYTTIKPADALNVPPFEERRAGWWLARASTTAPPRPVDASHRTVRLPVVDPPSRIWRLFAGAAASAELATAVRALDRGAALAEGVGPAVGVQPEPWAVVGAGDVVHREFSAAAAHAHASVGSAGTVALPEAASAAVMLP